MERRRNELDLADAVANLNATVIELKVTVAELKVSVATMNSRDGEDRQAAKDVSKDVDDLKLWRSRIRGQIAVIWALVGVMGGTIFAHFAHWIP